MKCNFILQLLFLALKQIIQCNSKNVPTIEDIKSYKYGSDPFTLAIIGDSGTTKEAKKVMELSSFDALLHLGDFDYNCLPDKYFIEVLNQQRSYQFMGVAGNHDAIPQCNKDIAQKFLNNIYYHMVSDKNNKTTCEFSASKYMWSCVYKNMRIIGLTPGVSGADSRKEQLSFLKTHLRDAKEDWKICSWHFYDKYYHTGKYQQYGNIVSGDRDGDESFYDYCKDHGAIIFSAHDHVYARTKVMLKFTKPVIDKFDENADGTVVQIRNGATFNILSGTGGYEVYVEQGEQKNYNHWRKKYAKGDNNENAKRFGGLFCNFNVDGNNRKAYCQFLRINSSEKVFDSFYIYRNDDPGSVTYKNIDENFEYEKLKAYKIENNIQDEPIIEKDETNKKDDPHSVKENNDSTKDENLVDEKKKDHDHEKNQGNDDKGTNSNNKVKDIIENSIKSDVSNSKNEHNSSYVSKILIGSGLFIVFSLLSIGIFLYKRKEKKNINKKKDIE